MLYGLHEISSEWVEVRDMLIALKKHVDGCKERCVLNTGKQSFYSNSNHSTYCNIISELKDEGTTSHCQTLLLYRKDLQFDVLNHVDRSFYALFLINKLNVLKSY